MVPGYPDKVRSLDRNFNTDNCTPYHSVVEKSCKLKSGYVSGVLRRFHLHWVMTVVIIESSGGSRR